MWEACSLSSLFVVSDQGTGNLPAQWQRGSHAKGTDPESENQNRFHVPPSVRVPAQRNPAGSEARCKIFIEDYNSFEWLSGVKISERAQHRSIQEDNWSCCAVIVNYFEVPMHFYQ